MPAAIASVDFATDDSATPMTMTKPAAFASGQMLVMFIGNDSGVLTDVTAATGFTLVTGATVDITGQRCKAFYHVWDGAEGASFNFGYNSGGAAAGALVRVTGADVTSPTLIAATGNSGANGSTLDSPSVNPTGADDLLLCALTHSGGGSAFSYTKPTGMTDRGSIQLLNQYQAIAIADLGLSSGSATGAKTWSNLLALSRQCGTFSVAIESAPAATFVRPTILVSGAAVNRAGSW